MLGRCETFNFPGRRLLHSFQIVGSDPIQANIREFRPWPAFFVSVFFKGLHILASPPRGGKQVFGYCVTTCLLPSILIGASLRPAR